MTIGGVASERAAKCTIYYEFDTFAVSLGQFQGFVRPLVTSDDTPAVNLKSEGERGHFDSKFTNMTQNNKLRTKEIH